MSHSYDLLDSFLKEIQKSYPSDLGYEYIIEERLKGSRIDIQPDIQVVDKAGHVICVVEVGYTRPEKIALYKELLIPDIRWYSKDGKFVNPHEHIHMTETRIIYYEEIPEEETWREVDLNDWSLSLLICENCFQTRYEVVKSEAYQKPDDQDVEVDYDKNDPKIFDKAKEMWLDDASIFGELWCNGSRWFCVWLCDECGNTGFMTGEELKNTIDWYDFTREGTSSFSYDEFLKQHYKELNMPLDNRDIIERIIRHPLYYELKKKATFEDLQEYISIQYDYEIKYGDIGKVPS